MARPAKTANEIEKEACIGRRLQKIRQELHLTQAELAKKYNRSEQTVRNWESGRCSIPNEVLEDFAKTYNVNINYLKGIITNPEIIDSMKQIRTLTYFFENAKQLGYVSDEIAENEYLSFLKYCEHYSDYKKQLISIEDIKAVLNSKENIISINFETGEVTINAKTKDDLDNAYQHLLARGIIDKNR